MTTRFAHPSFALFVSLVACTTTKKAHDEADGQTPEQAAALLCEGAEQVGADPATADVAHWAEAVADDLTHPGVREAFKDLSMQGRATAEPFFGHMADALRHEWSCPAARALFSVDSAQTGR